ncbi:MAG TPA: MAPEG family protein [Hyphomicrobiales bacterium]|nr:MAPEG family protein [Hyphomicrobiales bacterium]
MSLSLILLPLFIQVALTYFLLFWTARIRAQALTTREVHPRDVAVRGAWPERAQQIANAYHNQLQLPVLFFVVVILALITHKTGVVFVALEWAFVLLRIVHAAIHTGGNRIPPRFFAFAAGAAVLLAMWVLFAVRILFAV